MRTSEHLADNVSAVQSFKREPDSVGPARDWAAENYRIFGVTDDDLIEICKLLVSEAVTNAVKHGRGELYTVVVSPDLWIEVWDEGPLKVNLSKPGPDAEDGRGNGLLETLTTGYAITYDAERDSKCVRFQPQGSSPS